METVHIHKDGCEVAKVCEVPMSSGMAGNVEGETQRPRDQRIEFGKCSGKMVPGSVMLMDCLEVEVEGKKPIISLILYQLAHSSVFALLKNLPNVTVIYDIVMYVTVMWFVLI